MIINNKISLELIKGASLVTTGGGIPVIDQIKSVKKLANLKVELKKLEELPMDSFICLAAELGPTDVPPIEKKVIIGKMRDILEKSVGKKIAGIYPPEMGQESVVLEAAHFLKLPVADFDPVGFRAVPYIDVNIFNLKNIQTSYTPMVIGTDKNEILLLDSPVSYERLEEILRQMTQLSDRRALFLLGAVASVKDLIKNHLSSSSYSKAIELSKTRSLSELTSLLKPKSTIEAKVIGKKEIAAKGFFAEIVTMKTITKELLKVVVLNEALFIINDKNKVIAAVPDKILLINSKTLSGLPTLDLTKGSEVQIFVTDPEADWKKEKAQKIFGQSRFKELLKEVSHD